MIEWCEIQHNWNDYITKVLSNWNRITPEQLAIIEGNQTALIGVIQLSYSCNIEEADRQVKDWQNNLLGTKSNSEPSPKNLEEKLKQNQTTPETIEEQDSVIGSPYHKGY